MKVAVVNLKPGQSPISIAINEMSKRKLPTLVAFHDGDSLVGDEGCRDRCAAIFWAGGAEGVLSLINEHAGFQITGAGSTELYTMQNLRTDAMRNQLPTSP
ncbi:hypoxia up-regulated protein [Musa troglodytarum]|uniref:Hypoxia up-regulated protein n=1 Tax=Musa troglodytarum TaxID=320322 RepID=A0A9E7JDJ1_9LILI|nr:hypoxia up-regulated protein [Musa troglodytarum]